MQAFWHSRHERVNEEYECRGDGKDNARRPNGCPKTTGTLTYVVYDTAKQAADEEKAAPRLLRV